MPSMRYISEVPGGYLVRKAVNGKLYQSFFGETRYINNKGALEAAAAHRDKLIEEVGDVRSFQHQNIRNVTGIIGVAWHCRPNNHRNGAIVHFFRAQVSNEEGKATSKAWSIQKHGLWGAYQEAVRWRYDAAFNKPLNKQEVVGEFLNFITYFVGELDNPKICFESRTEMRYALINMVASGSMPHGTLELLPTDISKRFSSLSLQKDSSENAVGV